MYDEMRIASQQAQAIRAYEAWYLEPDEDDYDEEWEDEEE